MDKKDINLDSHFSYDDLEEFNIATGPQYNSIKTIDELESYIDDIADTVRIGLDQSIAILTPWFFNNMPYIYYQTTPRPEKVRHLSAIITGHIFETKQTVELWDRNKTQVTYIGPGGDRKILLHMANKLSNHSIKMGSLYFSKDNLLFLSTFSCSHHKSLDWENKKNLDKMQEARKLIEDEFKNSDNKIDDYLKNLDNDFVMYATPKRIYLTYRMVHHMIKHAGAYTRLEISSNQLTARLSIGTKDTKPESILGTVLHLIMKHGYDISRAVVVKVEKGVPEPVTVMIFVIRNSNGAKINKKSISMIRTIKALRTLGWVDTDDFDMLLKEPYEFSINAVNFIRASSTWVHVFLGKQNPYYYSEYKIRTTFFKHNQLTEQFINLFKLKFSPLKENERIKGDYEKFKKIFISEIDTLIDEVEKNIFKEIVHFIDSILKSNYFLPTKTGLAFRISANILDKRYYPNKPYGIYFIIGTDYRFFHVRWKDISRGGLRIVTPRNQSDYEFSLSGLFDEVYGLSYAQQLKNKDIPEGGSKAVLLLKPNTIRQRAVRGSVNALLDLLVEDDENHEITGNYVSYYNKEEIIYLGPDENMTKDLIKWISDQSERRGYKYASAFMSSKPKYGINHKEYGVTSEGIQVYLHHTLLFLGINPKKDKFSVKMTGGPDGDVAGNGLKIMYREYKENASIIAIADGFGAAYDPNGLDWKELLRLVEDEKPICDFNNKLLSDNKNSFVIRTDSPENIKIRNQLNFKVKSDIFIPAGGRPYTINDYNYKDIMDENGDPSMKAIIEGANIFLTNKAREEIQKKGVLIIKDSSANKTGVICSSYEIIACLVLNFDEFINIKEKYVKEVISILRDKAKLEAKLLFKEFIHNSKKKGLVEISTQISKEINHITDILLENFTKNQDEVLANVEFKKLILQHCPKILKDNYKDRILEKIPSVYMIALLSASIASFIVYKEGLGWLDQISEKDIYRAAIAYMKKEQLTQKYIAQLKNSKLENKKEIIEILDTSAARYLTTVDIESF